MGTFLRGHRDKFHYMPWPPVLWMSLAIIGVSIWVHYTEVILNNVDATLEVIGSGVTVNNLERVDGILIGTSVSYMVLAVGVAMLLIWRKVIEAEQDTRADISDHLALYLRLNFGARVCWLAVITWVVLAVMSMTAMCAYVYVFYLSLVYVRAAQIAHPLLIPNPTPTFPTCSAYCVDLTAFQIITNVPTSRACICSTSEVPAMLSPMTTAYNAIPGCLLGIFFLYMAADFMRAELNCQYAAANKERDVKQRLLGGRD